MIIAFIKFIFGLAVAILVTIFALYNRGDVTVTFSPLHADLTLPIYILGLGFLGVGVILGGISVWLNTAPARKKIRKTRKELKALRQDIEE
jgi:putative membrane protein